LVVVFAAIQPKMCKPFPFDEGTLVMGLALS